MQDPMAMATAMMALQRQAGAWIESTKASLAAAGLGFTSEDLAAIEASAAAHPYPEGHGPGMTATPADTAAAGEVQRMVMEAVYPTEGFDPADPRLAPVEGVTLAMAAIGAKAIGWSTDDAHITRVATALGVDRATWDRAAQEIRARVAGDVVLGAFYGQLYAQA